MPKLRVLSGRQVVKTRGPANAPVKIVVFSEFQCPFCGDLQVTLSRLMSESENDIQIDFRNFPLPIHQDAGKAAEAAFCAAEQGLFWQMHDQLFNNQRHLSAGTLVQIRKAALGWGGEA